MSSNIPVLKPDEAVARLRARNEPYQADYYAMYSSLLAGIVTDPALMLVPADDHVVHRGDGVFETVKCVGGRIYCLGAHLDRLAYSAGKIGLAAPGSREQLADVVLQTVRAGGRRDCLIRILLTRGPGGFGISPYECPRPTLYVIIYALKAPFMDQHPEGARVITSHVPVKAGFFATIKSCNYLPNALMKKEATDAGVDFALAFDEFGHLAEGATENAGVVTPAGRLRAPSRERILAGTTMLRALHHAEELVHRGLLSAVETGPITRDDLAQAREILIFGTTPDVTAVFALDGKPVGSGAPGPVFKALSELLLREIHGDTPHHISAW